jgi:hypothetical protein
LANFIFAAAKPVDFGKASKQILMHLKGKPDKG